MQLQCEKRCKLVLFWLRSNFVCTAGCFYAGICISGTEWHYNDLCEWVTQYVSMAICGRRQE